MIFYYSGGSPIVETTLKDPAIMPSFFVNVDTALKDRKKDNKPDARLRKLFDARRLTKSRQGTKAKKKGKVK